MTKASCTVKKKSNYETRNKKNLTGSVAQPHGPAQCSSMQAVINILALTSTWMHNYYVTWQADRLAIVDAILTEEMMTICLSQNTDDSSALTGCTGSK